MKAILDQNMTFTERFLAREIAKAIPNGGNIVILKLIERLGFGSRAAAVGALRKLAMAGIVAVRSMGQKGTYVKVLDKKAWQELAEEEV